MIDQTLIKKQITELNNKVNKLEEKYINEDIDRDLFQKFASKFKTEKKELEQKLSNPDMNSSNLEMII